MPLRAALLGLALVLAASSAKAQPEPVDDEPATSPAPETEAGEGAATNEDTPEPETATETEAETETERETETEPETETEAEEPPPFEFDEDDPFGYGKEKPADPTPSPEEETTGFPRTRFVWRNLFAGRLNPLGLINRFDIGFRVQILDKPGKLYKDSQASFLLHTAVSPAFTHIGGRIELQPLTVLRLGLTYAFMGSHAAFDFVQSFDDPNAEFDDKTLDDRADLNEATVGFYLEPGALVQAAFGPVAIRNETKFYYRSVGAVPDDDYFWDPSLDVLYPNGGWALTNDADLLFVFDMGLIVGARYTLTHVFYDEDVNLDGPAGDNVTTHRVGPAVLYKFYEDDPPTVFNAPTIGLLAQWWMKHRYRTGNAPAAGLEDRSVSQALPYLLLILSARGDFYPSESTSD